MSFRERVAFFGQMRANFRDTGAVQPSSRFLARAMAAPLRLRRSENGAAARILEIGPGTGAVTRAVAAAMGPEDRLVCYEINSEFVRYLERALVDDPILAPVADRVTVHNAPAQNLDSAERFDFGVCSAPLNNFDAPIIDAVLEALMGALQPGGDATLFEYIALPALRRAISGGPERERLTAAQTAKSRWIAAHGHGARVVMRNIPPARVHWLKRA